MRERNGWTDDGSKLRGSENKRCPNCKSDRYVNSLSREHCPACGLECDYWGGGANNVYETMMAINAREEEKRLAEQRRKDDEDEGYY